MKLSFEHVDFSVPPVICNVETCTEAAEWKLQVNQGTEFVCFHHLRQLINEYLEMLV